MGHDTFWKLVVSLGVPGLALGVLYGLLSIFSVDIQTLPTPWRGALAIIFLVSVTFITLFTLHNWRPARPALETSSVEVQAGAIIKGAVAGRDIGSGSPTIDKTGASAVSIGENVSIGGHIAGRDIHIHPDELRNEVSQLIGILQDRVERIRRELASHFRYAEVTSYLQRFDTLHERHIKNLRDGDIIRAHETLLEIHSLSFELQKDEFWTRHRHETPDLLYRLPGDIFQRGPLMEWYVGTAALEALVVQAMKNRWTRINDDVSTGSAQPNAEPVYDLITH
jgi:hypothetical protein